MRAAERWRLAYEALDRSLRLGREQEETEEDYNERLDRLLKEYKAASHARREEETHGQ